MPIHLNYQGTTCAKCGAEFISHKANCPCPACGTVAGDFCDFAAQTSASMKDHKQLYGKYFPDAWFSGSTADLVQGVIFEIFDNYEIEKPEDFTAFVITQLEAVAWEEGQEHLALQIEEIALEVFNIYRQDPDFREGALKAKPIDPKLKKIKADSAVFDKFLDNDTL